MFFLLPVGVEYRASRQPVVTFSLMGTCVLLFVLTFMAGLMGGVETFRTWFYGLSLVPANGRLYSWITALFMHAGLFHLLGNLVYLYLFGSCVEDILGRPQYLAFYLFAGVFANLAEVLFIPGHFAATLPILGASGAISACMGAFAVLLRRTRIEFRFLYFIVVAAGSKEFHLPSWLILGLWFLDDLVGMFGAVGESGGGVAFATHVGGFLLGALLGAIMRARGWRGDVDEEETEPTPYLPPVTRGARPSTPTRTIPAVPERSFFVWTNGAQAGPFPLGQIQEMRQLGSLAAEDLFWNDTTQTWHPLVELDQPGQ